MLEEDGFVSWKVNSSWFSNFSSDSEKSEHPVIIGGHLEWLKGVAPSVADGLESFEIFRSENVMSGGARVISRISSRT